MTMTTTTNTDTILTLADTARSFAGELTRNQLKVIRARLRRKGVTPTVPVTVEGHYAVDAGSPLHFTVGLNTF